MPKYVLFVDNLFLKILVKIKKHIKIVKKYKKTLVKQQQQQQL